MFDRTGLDIAQGNFSFSYLHWGTDFPRLSFLFFYSSKRKKKIMKQHSHCSIYISNFNKDLSKNFLQLDERNLNFKTFSSLSLRSVIDNIKNLQNLLHNRFFFLCLC